MLCSHLVCKFNVFQLHTIRIECILINFLYSLIIVTIIVFEIYFFWTTVKFQQKTIFSIHRWEKFIFIVEKMKEKLLVFRENGQVSWQYSFNQASFIRDNRSISWSNGTLVHCREWRRKEEITLIDIYRTYIDI